MYPDNNDQTQPTAVSTTDYLNEISAKPPRKKFLDKKMLIILGGVLAVIIAVIVIITVTSSGPDLKKLITITKTKYDNALSVIDYGTQNLNSGSLRQDSASASLVLAGQDKTFADWNGKNKLDKETTAKISDSKAVLAELKTAKDAGNLATIYKTKSLDYLDDILASLNSVRTAKGISKAYKATVLEYINEITELKTRISEN